jgi:hypothetical protein
MAETAAGVLWDLLTHLGHRAIDHGFGRLDKAAGLAGYQLPQPQFSPPPAPPAMPSVPRVQVPTLQSTIPQPPSVSEAVAPALGALGAVGLAGMAPRSNGNGPNPLRPPQVDRSYMPGRETAQNGPQIAASSEGGSYAAEVEAGVACPNCTRKHLAAARGAAEEAVKATRSGDSEAARRHLARVKAELAVLERYDLTEQKIANTPPSQREAVLAARDCAREIRERIDTPEEVALAWGAADEAIRFARSIQPTERDRQEVEIRLRDVDAYAAVVERDLLAPEHADSTLSHLPAEERAQALSARDDLRAAGRELDRRPLGDAEALSRASAHLAHAAAKLTPPPTTEEAEAILRECERCQKLFYDGMYRAMTGARGG